MLEQMLKKLFESDSKAASGRGSERIKADVLSRVAMEMPMKKQIRIKPLIIAAAAVVGIMSVALTVNASIDENTSYLNRITYWDSDPKEKALEDYNGDEEEAKKFEERIRRIDNATVYYMGKVAEAKQNGGIEVEKELDETDVVGYVEPCRISTIFTTNSGPELEQQLELVKKIEEDPGSLGLVPVGKSETFDGGLRIVNRHFENTNEITDDGKMYYSVRRVYTDDAENRLIASMYLGCLINFPDDEDANKPGVPHSSQDNQKAILDIFLDHTEDGCLYGYDWNTENIYYVQAISSSRRMYENGKGKYAIFYHNYDFKSNPVDPLNEDPVTVGISLIVGNDKIQWLD